jgi:anti-anti-sigma factor
MHTERSLDAQPEDHFSALVDLSGSTATDGPRVVVSGEVDALSADRLQEAVGDVLSDHRPRRIEIDFDGVTFVDSAGIRALVMCHAGAQQMDCRLTLTNPRRAVYRVLQITGLLEHLGVTKPPPTDGRRPATAPSGPADLEATG